MTELTQARVRELFDYRDDGQLLWKIRLGGKGVIGSAAGSKTKHGYIHIRLSGKTYKAHRLVFLWHHGHIPDWLDHVNMDRSDNRIENLRETDGSTNQANRRVRPDNESGLKGVNFMPRQNKWQARITSDRKQIYLGLFATKEEAHAAYMDAARNLFGAFARSA